MPNRTRANRETEVKLRVADLPAMICALGRTGAKLRGRVLERNTLYDTPGADLRRARCLLRVREEYPAAAATPKGAIPAGPRRTVLTWKAPVSGSGASRYKEKLEQEATVASGKPWAQILRSLGFRRTFQYEKYRTSYRWGGLHLDLDETPVGVFLELEGPPGAIDRTAARLNFAPRDYLRDTYWDLYAADCKRRGRVPKNMLFAAKVRRNRQSLLDKVSVSLY